MRTILLSLSLIAFTATAQDLTGTWYGMLKIMGQKLQLNLHFEEGENGWKATMDSPDQKTFGIPVDSVSWAEGVLYWEARKLGAKYEGKSNGKVISGTLNQAGMKLPLELSREEPAKAKRPQEPKAPFPYASREVKFENTKDAVTLAGTLTIPEGIGPFPAVVLVSGSGPQDRNEEMVGHKTFLVIADYLSRNGIAVLRYDDRGVGESTGSFSKGTTLDFARDAASALAYLNTVDEVNKDKLGVIGHSEGGLISGILAADNEDVDFVISLAGTSVRGLDIITHQSGLISKAEGASRAEIEHSQNFVEKMAQLIEKGASEKKIRKYVESTYDDLSQKEKVETPKGVYIQRAMGTMNTVWMREFLFLDPCEYWKRAQVPVYALFGSKDLQVDPAQNKKPMEECLAQSGQEVKVEEWEGLNHLFQNASTGSPTEYSELEQTIEPKVLQALATYILER